MKERRRFFWWVLFLLVLITQRDLFSGEMKEKETPVTLSGYYKILPARVEIPVVPGIEPGGEYFDCLNRLRLQFNFQSSSTIKGEVVYDIEAHFGDFTKTPFFQLLKRNEPKPYLNLEDEICRAEGDLYLKHSLYRAYIAFSLPEVEVKIGRQAIDWGPGRAWNPTNPFFPVNPLAIEKEEMVGTDAISLEFPFHPLASLQVVATGKEGSHQPVLASRYRTNLAGTDLSLMAYCDQEKSMAGLDFSRTVIKVELHGSLVGVNGREDFTSATIGADYTFPGTLKLGAEYFYNGEGREKSREYDWLGLLLGEKQFLAEDYLFFGLDYEITPLLRLQAYLVRLSLIHI